MVEEVIKIKADTKEAEASIKKVTKEVDKTNESTSMLSGQLDTMTGGAITKFKSLASGLKTVALGFKSVGAAIAATGLGLLVVTVASLAAAFRSSEEGQNKFAKIMSVIGALTGNMIDLLADLGEKIIAVFEDPKQAWENFKTAILENMQNRVIGLIEFFPKLGEAISLVFEGEFLKAGKIAADAVGKITLGVESVTDNMVAAAQATKDFVKEQVEEGKAAARVADMRAKADKIERDLLVERSEIEQQIAELRLKSRQEEEFSAEERKKALLDAQELEDGLLAKEVEYLRLRADAQEMENTFARSNKENLNEEARLRAAVNNQIVARTNQQRQTQRELNRINKEIAAQEKQQATEQAAFEKELREAMALDAEEKRALEIEKEQEKYDALIEKAIEYGLDTLEIEQKKEQAILAIREKFRKEDLDAEKKASDEKIALEKKVADSKKAIINQLFSAVIANLKQGSVEQKALAVAQATWNTFEAVTAALGAKPYGPWNIAQAVGTGLFGLAQVRQILNTNPTASASPSVSGGSISGAAFQPASVNIPGQSGINSIISGLQNNNQAIKAYVVTGEVTSGQELERKRLNNATFG